LFFSPGKDPHSSYPFGIHSQRSLPWNYQSIDDRFYLQSKQCKKSTHTAGSSFEACRPRRQIREHDQFENINKRLHHGIHPNTPLAYQPIGGLVTIVRQKTADVQQLRLRRLNDSWRLLGKAAILEDHKQWIMAVASGRVDQVTALVQARGAGVQALITEYERASLKLYKPKGYTENDIQQSIWAAHVSESSWSH
jgi:hypothetical protein